MAKVQNTQQYPVRLEGVGLVEPGEIIDVSPELAKSLTCQEGNWRDVKPAKSGEKGSE